MRSEFPDDDVCLQTLFNNRYGDLKACPKCGVRKPTFYRVKGRMSFVCKDCRHQIYPLVGTIFEKTTTPLTDWFHAIYLFSVSKNGVSAKEIERQVGVSYKTAHRMAKKIRLIMWEDDFMLGGGGKTVQADETYVGGRCPMSSRIDNKTPVLAALEVDGKMKTQVVNKADMTTVTPFIFDNVSSGSTIHTDESKIYKKVRRYYNNGSVRHISKKYVENGVTTNHLEGFFGNAKRAIDGTYHAVSPYYLHSYFSEFVFRYNHRHELVFPLLLERVAKHA
jgi:transposase